MIISITIILFLMPIILLTPRLLKEHRIMKYGTSYGVYIHNTLDDGMLRELFFTIDDKEMSTKVLPGILCDPIIGDTITVMVYKNDAVVI